MVRLDVETMAFCAAVVSLAAMVVIVVFGTAGRSVPRWGPFAVSCGGYGLGVLLILLGHGQPALFPTLGGNLVVMLSAAALHVGACRLAGRGEAWWPTILVLAAFALTEIVMGGRWGSDSLRIVAVSLIRVPILLDTARILRRTRRTHPAMAAPLIEIVLIVWSVFLVVRGGAGLGIGPGLSHGPGFQAMQSLYFGTAGLGNLLIAIALLRMDGAMVSAALHDEVARRTRTLEERITELEAAHRVVHDELALRNALIDTLPIPVFAKTAEGRFIIVNHAFEQQVGVLRAEVIAKNSGDLSPPDLALHHVAVDQSILAGGGPVSYEALMPLRDGTVRPMLLCKGRFNDADGRVAGIVGSMTDITELTRMAEDLRRSEADLRAILDNMPDIFFRADADGRVLMVSRSVEEGLGYPVEDLLGKPTALILVDPTVRPVILAAMDANGGAVTDFEIQMRHKDGHAVWVAASIRLLRGERGELAATEGTLRLIDDRKRAEARLRESQSLIQALLDCSPDAILLVAADGVLLACNDVFARRFGHPAAKLVGTNLWTRIALGGLDSLHQNFRDVLDTAQPVRGVFHRDGRSYDNGFYPVANAEGRIDRVAVFSRDITAQSEAAARITHHMAEVERSNAELEQFAYVASHDLREPLRMISSYLSLIERRYRDRFDDEGLEFLGYAREGARRMDRLILDLLDYARIERGGHPIEPTPVVPMITQAITDLGPLITDSAARVVIEDTASPAYVLADGVQVGRLFLNLIGNALKYRVPERPPLIRVSGRRLGEDWHFSVSDNGIGIEPDYYDRIFRIFQRLHPRHRYDGTGIGLAICKRIIDRHGGRIWVESTPGSGSVFSFTLRAAEPPFDAG